MAHKYIDQAALELRLTPATLARLFDDTGDGVVNTAAVDAVIDDAEAEVDGLLGGQYAMPLGEPNDRLLKKSCLDFAVSFSYDRNPEYVRTFGEQARDTGLYKRARDRMLAIKSALQVLPDQPAGAATPLNVGGVVVDTGPRMMIASSDGTSNNTGF